jgi:lipoprotein-releasing system permease protein
MLAWRYLNPRRASLSWISLISLGGVTLGVLVLVVVLAVMAGLEREIKSRLLGFTPHLLLEYAPGIGGPVAAENWREISDLAEGLETVEAATPYIQDNVVFDFEGFQRPMFFRAVDTQDAGQMAGIEEMLDLENFPDGSADLGLDNRAVVSSIVAKQFRLIPGDVVRLYSTRNFREVMSAYKTTERPPVREEFEQQLGNLRELLADEDWQRSDDGEESVAREKLVPAYEAVMAIYDEQIRTPEKDVVLDMIMLLEAGGWNDEETRRNYPAKTAEGLELGLAKLDELEVEQMDSQILKDLKEIVLPKDVEVVGIYQASQHVMTPDLFVPLPLGQDLIGLADGVQGVSLRVRDPYEAGLDKQRVEQALAAAGMPEWQATTWMAQYRDWFSLIARERVMMYFALSFIVLVSAFSMMAVMFTVTIQKRQEIGVMKALGATPGQIARVFLYQGMVMGALGGLLGIGLGRVVIHFRAPIQGFLRDVLRFDPFPASFHGFSTIPAYMNPVEHLGIALAAFALCALAALVPATPAARSDAAKSLRNL